MLQAVGRPLAPGRRWMKPQINADLRRFEPPETRNLMPETDNVAVPPEPQPAAAPPETAGRLSLFGRTRAVFRADSLRGKVARGGVALASGAAVGHAAQLARNMILARLLLPADFGLMALVLAVIQGFEAFTELGISWSVVQNRRGDRPEFLNVAWWFSAVRGFGLFLLAFLAAPLVCMVYGDWRLLDLVRISSLAILFNALVSPRMHVLQKQMHFARWVIVTQAPVLASVILAVVTALIYRSVWALVVSFTLEPFLRLVLSFIMCPFRPRLRIEAQSRRDLSIFAKGVIGLPILTFVFMQTDIFVVARLLPLETVGLYFLARSLATVPELVFGKTIGPMLLPAFSHGTGDVAKRRGLILKANRLLMTIAGPLVAAMIASAYPLLTVAYGQTYAAAKDVFRILALCVLFRILAIVLANAYLALGQPRLQRQFVLIRAALAVVLIVPGVTVGGSVGAATVVLFALVISSAYQVLRLERVLHLTWHDYARALVPGAALSLLPLAAGLVSSVCVGARYEVHTFLVGIGCIIAWAIGLACIRRRPYEPAIAGTEPGTAVQEAGLSSLEIT
jgi:O-antigen/teichoic acid export membrane protein